MKKGLTKQMEMIRPEKGARFEISIRGMLASWWSGWTSRPRSMSIPVLRAAMRRVTLCQEMMSRGGDFSIVHSTAGREDSAMEEEEGGRVRREDQRLCFWFLRLRTNNWIRRTFTSSLDPSLPSAGNLRTPTTLLSGCASKGIDLTRPHFRKTIHLQLALMGLFGRPGRIN